MLILFVTFFSILLANPAPTINSIDPTIAFPGPNSIDLHGTSFLDLLSVRVGGFLCNSLSATPDGTTLSVTTPILAAGTYDITVVTNSGTQASLRRAYTVNGLGSVWYAGRNVQGSGMIGSMAMTTVFTAGNLIPGHRAVQVSVSDAHTVVLLSDWSLCGAGAADGRFGVTRRRDYTQLTAIPQPWDAALSVTKVQTTADGTIALLSDGSVYVTGLNTQGSLGLPSGTAPTAFTLLPLPAGRKAVAIASRHYSTGITLDDNTLMVCGSNSNGQLGVGEDLSDHYGLTAVTLPRPGDPFVVVYGWTHSAIIYPDDGALYMCGDNSHGQLGLGSVIDQHLYTHVAGVTVHVTDVSLGEAHSVIMATDAAGDNTVLVCGANSESQLSLSGMSNRLSFVPLTSPTAGLKFAAAVAGGRHTAVILDDGQPYVVGDSTYGQLGYPSSLSLFAAASKPSVATLAPAVAASAHGTVIIWNTAQPPQIAGTAGTPLAAGLSYTLTIIGAGFRSGSLITVGGHPCLPNSVLASSLSCVVLATATGARLRSADLVVRRDDGLAARRANFLNIGTTLAGTGDNSNGMLGMGAVGSQMLPGLIGVPPDRVAVSTAVTGIGIAYVLLDDGTLLMSGNTASTPLGLSRLYFTGAGTPFALYLKVAAVTAGRAHSMLLLEDGSVWVQGDNTGGALGLSSSIPSSASYIEVSLPTGRSAVDIRANSDISVVLLDNGELLVSGANFFGQLGLGHTTAVFTFTSVPFSKTVGVIVVGLASIGIISTDWTLSVAGANEYGQLGVGGTTSQLTFATVLSPVVAVAMGRYHVVALTTSGTVSVCGRNNAGQIGTTDTTSFVTLPSSLYGGGTVAGLMACDSDTYFLLSDGSVYAMGSNANGKFGTGDALTKTVPVLVPLVAPCKALVVGTLVAVYMMEFAVLPTLTSVAPAVSPAFASTTLTLYGAALNAVMSVRVGPVACTSIAIASNGTSLQCTLAGTLPAGRYDVMVTTALLVSARLARGYTARGDLAVYVSGQGANYCQLAQGSAVNRFTATVVSMPPNRVAVAAAASVTATALLTSDGTIFMAGSEQYGEFGYGTTALHCSLVPVTGSWGSRRAVAIALSTHMLVIMDDGTLWGSGRNAGGQLGLSTTTDMASFTQIPLSSSLLGGAHPVDVSVGDAFSAVTLSNGHLLVAGDNSFGQLCLNSHDPKTSFVAAPSPFSRVITVASTGSSHTIALLDDGTVAGCGYNSYGALGTMDSTHRTYFTRMAIPTALYFVAVTAGKRGTAILARNGDVYVAGDNTLASLGLGATAYTNMPNQLILSGSVGCWLGPNNIAVIKGADATVRMAGGNAYGQYGFGTTTSFSSPVLVNAVPGRTVAGMAWGDVHSVFLVAR